MAHSDPEIRERIVQRLIEHVKSCGEMAVDADSMCGLKQKLGLEEYSNSKVDQALRSLTYNPAHRSRGVRLYRPRRFEAQPRSFRVLIAT